MQKIGDITNTADKNGEFTNGNVAAGIAPTLLDAGWFNTVQRELINAVQGAGIKLDNKNDSQLFAAIKKLIDSSAVEVHDASLTQKGIVQLTDVTGSSNTLAATQKLITDVNNNANTKLAKSQNGADIPNKSEFIKNLGLAETVNLAKGAVPSSGGRFSGPVRFDSDVIVGNNDNCTLIIKPQNSSASPVSMYIFGFNDRKTIFEVADKGGWFWNCQRMSDGHIQFNINGKLNVGDYSNFDNRYDNIPIGVPLPYPHRYTPVGYLTCNGQSFDKSLYPKLAEAYPGGRLPDLRGEFIRGWDDSRGVDPGRVCGTWQADSTKRIQLAEGNADSRYMSPNQGPVNGYWYPLGRDVKGNATDTSIANNTGGNETRPRNVAFNYIVRAA